MSESKSSKKRRESLRKSASKPSSVDEQSAELGLRTAENYDMQLLDGKWYVCESPTTFLCMDIPGPPVPKALVVGRGRLMPSPASRAYMDHIRELSRAKLLSLEWWNADGPFKVWITANVKSLSKGDLDNICKSLLDGLQPFLIANDVDVHSVEMVKVASKSPGLQVVIANHAKPGSVAKERKPHASQKARSQSKASHHAGLRRGKRPSAKSKGKSAS